MPNKKKLKRSTQSSPMWRKEIMDKPRQIAIVYRQMRISEQGSNVEYWLAQPPSARLAALEEIRRECHAWKYGTESGFQRVIPIVRRRPRGKE